MKIPCVWHGASFFHALWHLAGTDWFRFFTLFFLLSECCFVRDIFFWHIRPRTFIRVHATFPKKKGRNVGGNSSVGRQFSFINETLTIECWAGHIVGPRESLNVSLCLILIVLFMEKEEDGEKKKNDKLDKKFLLRIANRQRCGNHCTNNQTMTLKEKKSKREKNINFQKNQTKVRFPLVLKNHKKYLSRLCTRMKLQNDDEAGEGRWKRWRNWICVWYGRKDTDSSEAFWSNNKRRTMLIVCMMRFYVRWRRDKIKKRKNQTQNPINLSIWTQNLI